MGGHWEKELSQAKADHGAGRLAEAQSGYRRVLEACPDQAEAWHLLGALAQQVGRSDVARQFIGRAIAIDASVADYHSNLGTVLSTLGEIGLAVDSYLRALALAPRHADANFSLAGLLARQKRYVEAGRHYLAVLETVPDHPDALGHGALMLAQGCDWDGLDALIPRLEAAAQNGLAVPPFPVLALTDDPVLQLAAARARSARVESEMAGACTVLSFHHRPGEGGRIRIGYLSGDYREHATAWLMAELFELHDRGRFEVMAFSLEPSDRSPMRERLERGADRFIDLGSLDPVTAARAIHAEGTDILVDLKGWTADARPQILALRPAPIQVAYLGFPGTMGAGFIDWVLADSHVIFEGDEVHYSERVIRLPGCYQINDRRRPLPAPPLARSEYGLPETAFVFACFNNTFKITRPVFAQWMRLLAAVEDSVLWLLDPGGEAVATLRAHARAAGIAPARLVFAQRVAFEAHLARHGAADLFLDTFPYTAHTTASDALWAGLPLVTRSGRSFASRVAGSLLAATGMKELVTATPAAYEALAQELAGDRARLGRLRQTLEAGRTSLPLWDTPALVRAIEAAYETMLPTSP